MKTSKTSGGCARQYGLSEEAILPCIDDPGVALRVTVAIATAALQESLAGLSKGPDAVPAEARAVIDRARAASLALQREGLIPPPPE